MNYNFQDNNNNNSNSAMMVIGVLFLLLMVWEYVGKQYFADPNSNIVGQQAITKNNKINQTNKDNGFVRKQVNVNNDNAVSKTSDVKLEINTNKVSGKIALQGSRLEHFSLKEYQESPESNSKNVVILNNDNNQKRYFIDFGWQAINSSALVPDINTIWKIEGNDKLSTDNPIKLLWQNSSGLTFMRKISIDDKYLVTVQDTVINKGQEAITLKAHSAISRNKPENVSSFFILHEGALGYLNNKLIEEKYEDMDKSNKSYKSTGGWSGITDKYWLTAIIPPQNILTNTTYSQKDSDEGEKIYQTKCTSAEIKIAAGEEISYTQNVFIGPKKLELLDDYEQTLNIESFDLAVDFGWFYFLTKPLFKLLTSTKNFLGNFGLSILLLTIILKLLFFPLANKSYRSMARMKNLQPKMTQIRELYKEDKMKMNQELMNLYKTEKVNPVSGCLPMLLQMPIFFALYKVLFISIEMRHAPFFGWIHDLSAPDPTTVFNLFGLIPWMPPSFLQIGAWPLIMGITMVLQQKLNPAPVDPIQAKIFLIMPIMFTFMFASFPSGLVIYWAWSNTLTIAQQWLIMRKTNN